MKPTKSIIYKNIVSTRFGDLDPYGHLNAKHYLDLIATSRLKYLQSDMNTSVEAVMKQGYAWYLRHSSTYFNKPIKGLQDVMCSSWVASIEGSKLLINFKLESEGEDVTFAEGSLTYIIVGMENGKPRDCPDWMRDLFFTAS